ncbi:hypothetical protein [Kingella potus]|uniref:hypothetical protein n=1 Tax=Kingella potus TaxID=265175 RepID=UPI000E1C39DC|nr:hypothetical protein [Kingella potus]UOP00341.1 hypothetical protein LVJ84_10615 [Kingella potus]
MVFKRLDIRLFKQKRGRAADFLFCPAAASCTAPAFFRRPDTVPPAEQAAADGKNGLHMQAV